MEKSRYWLCGYFRIGWLASAKPVLVEEFELFVEPLSTPPFPSEAWSQPGTHQVPPNLLFHPVFDKRKAPAVFSHLDQSCGDGVIWSVDISTGQILYFVVAPNGADFCDATGVDVTISKTK